MRGHYQGGPHQLLAGVKFLYKVGWEEFDLGK